MLNHSELVKLLEEWTRAEIAARILPMNIRTACDYYEIKIGKEEEIREELFGTSSLVELADKFGLLRKTRVVEQPRSRLPQPPKIKRRSSVGSSKGKGFF